MHVSRVELCNNNGVGPGRVGHAQPENTVLETSTGIDSGEPVKRLVPLLVRIAITPVDNLLSGNCLLPYEGEVPTG